METAQHNAQTVSQPQTANTPILTIEQQEWLSWQAYSREAQQKRRESKHDDVVPFEAVAKKVLQDLQSKIETEAPLYQKAEENRETVLSRYILNVTQNIHKSIQIPSYCNLPRTVETLGGLNEKIESALQAIDNGQNVFLTGNVGTGKTYAALQAVYRWCRTHFRYGFATDIVEEVRKGIPPKPCILNFQEYEETRRIRVNFPRFVNSKVFLHELRSTFDGAGSENAVMERYLAPPLLIFDDLGAEKTSDWTRDRVLTLLEMRLYDRRKQTFITSNLAISEKFGMTISQAIDDRLSSRIQEQCACFRLDGEDLRLRKVSA